MTRLFLDRELSDDTAKLSEREANYIGNVLRLRRGDRVVAFNGRGQERSASISVLTRRHAELALDEHLEPLPEPGLALTLVQALPKSDPMDLVVQKSTELGVRSLWPVSTDYSVVRLDAERAEKRAAHWTRVAQSACEQCGRHCPPQIRPVAPLSERLAEIPAAAEKLALDTRSGSAFDAAAPAPEVFVLIGPEGGFSPADLELIDAHGFTRLRLGPRTLRAETAAVAAAALLQAFWGDLR